MTRKVILGFVFVILFFALAQAQNEKSVSISGHTFTVDIDEYWNNTQGQIFPYDQESLKEEEEMGISLQPHAEDWTGSEYIGAFTSPGTPDTPSDNVVDIYVLKPSGQYLSDYKNHWGKDYPGMQNDKTTLKRAIDVTNLDTTPGLYEDESEKEIDYNGEPAYLVEREHMIVNDQYMLKGSHAVIAFVKGEDMIVIDVLISHAEYMRAWDFLDSITVE